MNKPASHQIERAIGQLAGAIAAQLWERLIEDPQQGEAAPASIPQLSSNNMTLVADVEASVELTDPASAGTRPALRAMR